MNLRAPATTGLDDQDQSLASGPFNTSRRIGAFRLRALYQDRPELPDSSALEPTLATFEFSICEARFPCKTAVTNLRHSTAVALRISQPYRL